MGSAWVWHKSHLIMVISIRYSYKTTKCKFTHITHINQYLQETAVSSLPELFCKLSDEKFQIFDHKWTSFGEDLDREVRFSLLRLLKFNAAYLSW
jgi:hypothetical protein